jgi:predicted RND superfamily exporter protein
MKSFADDLRSAAWVEGKPAHVAGSLVLSSDIADAMKSDGPRATLLALLCVLAICVFTFRSIAMSLAAVAALAAGVLAMLGFLAWTGQRLNFSNFVALPITFGIGADYSINMLKRYQTEGVISLESALSATGGAVALCSVMTIIGFGSLLVADNRALFSFGVFAVSGELASLGTAVLGLPAVLALVSARLSRGRELAVAPPSE